MFKILIFGDSNSWGYVDEDNGKKFDKRWSIIFSSQLKVLGIENTVNEDCLPGRTTDIDDLNQDIHINGAKIFKSSILANSPLDLILVMLGTNDLKKIFNRTEEEVSQGIEKLITIAQNTFSGKGNWHDMNISKLVVITPPILGERSNDKNWDNYEDWKGGFEKSTKLQKCFEKVCEIYSIPLIDSNNFISSSCKDPIHWSKKTHQIFGKKIAEEIYKIIIT